MSRTHWIRASEVGMYAYCARAWWLQNVKGIPGRNRVALQAGDAVHRAHGRRVNQATWLYRLGWCLLIMALALLAWGIWHYG
ncbi:MAG: hypothetical protein Kow0047_20070 [Anaerolineae bacterium]